MRILHLTPGAGAMFCGNCLRDNALVAALRARGHDALMVPLYLPLTLDETDQTAGTPIFFTGVNVYLEQKSAFFRGAPGWLHRLLASRRLLKWAGRKTGATPPQVLGELTLSMLQGEHGRQARELEELIAWLKNRAKPDVICLSNALLLGLAHRLRSELGVAVMSHLQGEDAFLDSLPEPFRTRCWQTMAARATELDLFVAPSRYFANRMQGRLALPAERVRVVYNGIHLAGYAPADSNPPTSPAQPDYSSPPGAPRPMLGYFARMCREKGLDSLVEAYLILRERGRVPGLRLRVGGSCGPAEEPFVASLRDRLRQKGLLGEAEFHPNLDRDAKIALLRSLSVFSVPALYGEAFGLYVIEALAAGVPVVQPRVAAFPELSEATGGGLLCEPGDPHALASALEELLLDQRRARALGKAGQRAVFEKFSAEAMGRETARVLQELCPTAR